MSALTSARIRHASSTGAALFVLRRCVAGTLLALSTGGAAFAQQPMDDARDPAARAATDGGGTEPEANLEGEPAFALGPLEYRAARGLRFGDSGLTVGGFTTVELERPDRGPTEIALDSVNFLAHYEPVERLRVFAELEVGGLFAWEPGDGVDSSPLANFERLYVEYSHSDALNVRFGKFLTPVGQWNLAPAEPFVWTTTQPAILELGIDEHQTGISVFGSFYPAKRRVSYWIYGQVIDAFDVESDEAPAERSVGARLETSDARGEWTFGGSLLASKLAGEWSTSGGLDAKWRGQRLEISSELLVSGGDVPGRDYWGVFVEAAYPLDQLSPKLAKLYVVGRAEHFDARGAPGTQLVDFGLTWLPKVWLNLKAGYRAAIRNEGSLGDGLKISLSVLF